MDALIELDVRHALGGYVALRIVVSRRSHVPQRWPTRGCDARRLGRFADVNWTLHARDERAGTLDATIRGFVSARVEEYARRRMRRRIPGARCVSRKNERPPAGQRACFLRNTLAPKPPASMVAKSSRGLGSGTLVEWACNATERFSSTEIKENWPVGKSPLICSRSN